MGWHERLLVARNDLQSAKGCVVYLLKQCFMPSARFFGEQLEATPAAAVCIMADREAMVCASPRQS